MRPKYFLLLWFPDKRIGFRWFETAIFIVSKSDTDKGIDIVNFKVLLQPKRFNWPVHLIDCIPRWAGSKAVSLFCAVLATQGVHWFNDKVGKSHRASVDFEKKYLSQHANPMGCLIHSLTVILNIILICIFVVVFATYLNRTLISKYRSTQNVAKWRGMDFSDPLCRVVFRTHISP